MKTKTKSSSISNLREFETVYLPNWKQRTSSQTRAELLASIPEEVLVEKLLSGDFYNILETSALGLRKTFQPTSKVTKTAIKTTEISKESDLDDDIQILYDEIANLLKKKSPLGSTSTQNQISQKLKALREVQTARAQQLGAIFQKNLCMPINAGSDAISTADELLKRYGNITSS